MKPKEKKEIFNFLEYNKNILQSYGVKKIGLFGSYVHNQQNKNSDIDILVEFHADKKNYNNFINLVYYLEDNLNTKIDLLTIESLSPYIGQRILNEVEYVSIKWRVIQAYFWWNCFFRIGMRDKLIHGYFSVDYEIVWDVAKNIIPEFKNQLIKIMDTEKK